MDNKNNKFNRRLFLAATGTAVTSATTGCLFSDSTPEDGTDTQTDTETRTGTGTATEPGTDTTTSGGEQRSLPSVVAPDEPAVYIPSHFDERNMIGMQETGPYMMSLMYTLVHDFWVFGGKEKSYVPVERGQSMHIMSTLWEPEYGHLLPTGNPDITIETADGEVVESKALWSMLAQQMGPHFGDNVGFPTEGEYSVTIDVDPASVRQLGDYTSRFNSSESVTFDFDYAFDDVTGLRTQLLNDGGDKGALPPAQMEGRPTGELPAVEDLPGEHIGVATSGQAEFVVQVLDTAPEGIDSDDPYLAVSVRTPYNKYPLPFMGIRSSFPGDETRLNAVLEPGIHPDFGYHYGVTVPELTSGETLRLEAGSPPQISRHRGYQTAFIDFDDLQFTV